MQDPLWPGNPTDEIRQPKATELDGVGFDPAVPSPSELTPIVTPFGLARTLGEAMLLGLIHFHRHQGAA
jgi:hypothetical protein